MIKLLYSKAASVSAPDDYEVREKYFAMLCIYFVVRLVIIVTGKQKRM